MKTSRAASIAKILNNTKKWHVHGHGISKEVLVNDLKLKIQDFGGTPELSFLIRCYHDLISDYMSKLRTKAVIHFAGYYKPFM